MFSLICARINVWVNNCEAGDLRRIRPHYDVTIVVVKQMIVLSIHLWQTDGQAGCAHQENTSWDEGVWTIRILYISLMFASFTNFDWQQSNISIPGISKHAIVPSERGNLSLTITISMVSCQKGPTRHAYAWQIGPFWQDTLYMMRVLWCHGTYQEPV